MSGDRVAKRFLDVVLGLMGFIISLPLGLVIAFLIRLDSPGGVFFYQTRIGLGGRPFTIWKFRTMRIGADRDWIAPSKEEFSGYIFQETHDLRITRIGTFLRRTSLDELPQLINVLKGEMALVGPRPEIPEMVALYSPDMHRRHEVLPGITGLAQVSGRGELSTGEIMAYDLEYCDAWSLRLDFMILLRTLVQVVSRTGAR